MKLPKLAQSWGDTTRTNSVMLWSNLLLGAAVVALTLQVLNTHERVVVIPPQMDKRAEVGWNTANKEYIESFGLYIASMVGNITPKNVTLVADAVGAFLSADIYPQIRTQILSLADDPVFQKSNAINYFTPRQVIYELNEHKEQKVYVLGDLVSVSFQSGVNSGRPEGKPVVYEMTMEIRAGRPLVTQFTSYQGTMPHTSKWEAAQKKPDQKQQEDIPVLRGPGIASDAGIVPIQDSETIIHNKP